MFRPCARSHQSPDKITQNTPYVSRLVSARRVAYAALLQGLADCIAAPLEACVRLLTPKAILALFPCLWKLFCRGGVERSKTSAGTMLVVKCEKEWLFEFYFQMDLHINSVGIDVSLAKESASCKPSLFC